MISVLAGMSAGARGDLGFANVVEPGFLGCPVGSGPDVGWEGVFALLHAVLTISCFFGKRKVFRNRAGIMSVEVGYKLTVSVPEMPSLYIHR